MPTLTDSAGYPIITYNREFSGGSGLAGSHRSFPHSSTKVAPLKGSLLRNFACDVIEMLAQQVPRAALTSAKPLSEPTGALAFAERTDLHIAREGPTRVLPESLVHASALPGAA